MTPPPQNNDTAGERGEENGLHLTRMTAITTSGTPCRGTCDRLQAAEACPCESGQAGGLRPPPASTGFWIPQAAETNGYERSPVADYPGIASNHMLMTVAINALGGM